MLARRSAVALFVTPPRAVYSTAQAAEDEVRIFNSTLAAPAASIDTGANGIIGTYSNLDIWVIARTDEATAFSACLLRVNGDSGANYDFQHVQGVNATASATSTNGQTAWNQMIAPGTSCAAGVFAVWRISIPAYAQTTAQKTVAFDMGQSDTAAANSYARQMVANWRSTAAINQLTVLAPAGKNLVAGSRLTIYGLA